MADGSVIRNFMVALGFKTDNTGLGQMQDAMKGVELKAIALKGALLALASGAVVAVRQTASELDKLYFSSQRIGASATNITAFGNAISQMGGNAESAIDTLETLAEKMRNSPGYEGMLNSLGVNTTLANGEIRDRVDVMKDLSGVLSKMPAYQANAYAQSLGIDQKTLLAMRDGKFLANMEKYQKIQEQLGMNDALTQSGNEFMTEYRDLNMMTKTGFQVIVMQAGKALIPILRLLNQLVQTAISSFSQLNPEIKNMLGVGLRFTMVTLIFGGLIKTFAVLFRFIPSFKSLIGLLKVLRLVFLTSPIGIILALASALALLYNDFKTWKEGGKSVFDWSKWTGGIDKIMKKIKDFIALLGKVKDKVINFVQKIVSDPVAAVKEVAEEAKKALYPTEPTQQVKAINAVSKNIVDSVKNITQKSVAAAVATAKSVDQSVKSVVHEASSLANTIVEVLNINGTKRVYKMSDGTTEIRDNGTVAWRNNNPGNLKFGFNGSADKTVKTKRSREKALSDAQKRYKGVVDLDQFGNAIFATPQLGAEAKAKLLKNSFGDLTVTQMLRKYAVDDYSGKANHKSYEGVINKEAQNRGVSLMNKTINSMSDKEFEALAMGMVIAEGVKKGTVSRSGGKILANQSSQVLSLNNPVITQNPHKNQINTSNSNTTAGNVVINQSYKTDMTINGAKEPIESANAVTRQQENQLIIMSRNAKSALA